MTNTDKQQILDLHGQGFTYAHIADTIGISMNTVKSVCFRKDNINTHICKQCGKSLPHKNKTKPKTFCSDHCRYTWWNHIRKERSNVQSTTNI